MASSTPFNTPPKRVYTLTSFYGQLFLPGCLISPISSFSPIFPEVIPCSPLFPSAAAAAATAYVRLGTSPMSRNWLHWRHVRCLSKNKHPAMHPPYFSSAVPSAHLQTRFQAALKTPSPFVHSGIALCLIPPCPFNPPSPVFIYPPCPLNPSSPFFHPSSPFFICKAHGGPHPVARGCRPGSSQKGGRTRLAAGSRTGLRRRSRPEARHM